jgi:ABC-type cobalamin transport system permease subunit
MHEIAVVTLRKGHPAFRRTKAMTATSRLLAVGSADRIITSTVITFAMAVTVVTDTNAIVVLTVMTVAGIVRTSVLYMAVAHVKSIHIHLIARLRRNSKRCLAQSATQLNVTVASALTHSWQLVHASTAQCSSQFLPANRVQIRHLLQRSTHSTQTPKRSSRRATTD